MAHLGVTNKIRARNLHQRLRRLGSTLDTKHIMRRLDPAEQVLKERIEANFQEWKGLVQELDARLASLDRFRDQFMNELLNLDLYRKWDEEAGKKVQLRETEMLSGLGKYLDSLYTLRSRLTLYSPRNKKLW